MPTRTFTIYEVPNSYVSWGGSTTISSVHTFVITDDDGAMQATDALDTGTAQAIMIDGVPADSYQFYYNDTIIIGGASETVKTFQVVIGGVTHSYVMNDDGLTIPGAGAGVSFSLDTYSGYTAMNYADMPCFVRGTRIETTAGQRLIEDLQPGDMVRTADHGFQPVRWIGCNTLSLRDLIARPHLQPVRIPAHSFARDLPSRDLLVSPQHRIILKGWEIELNFGVDEAFAPAKALIGRKGIRVDRSLEAVEYFHLMFDRHEVIFSEDLATESFLVGDTIRDGMDQAQLKEILEIFPELIERANTKFTQPARPILRRFEISTLEDIAA